MARRSFAASPRYLPVMPFLLATSIRDWIDVAMARKRRWRVALYPRCLKHLAGSHVPKSDCLSLTTAQLQWRATGTSDQHLLVASSQAYTKPSTMRPSHSSRSTAAHRDPAGRTRGDVPRPCPRPRRALAATITAHRPLISDGGAASYTSPVLQSRSGWYFKYRTSTPVVARMPPPLHAMARRRRASVLGPC